MGQTARQNAVPIALAEADQRPPRGRGRSGAALGDVARSHLPMSARGACFRGVSRRMRPWHCAKGFRWDISPFSRSLSPFHGVSNTSGVAILDLQ